MSSSEPTIADIDDVRRAAEVLARVDADREPTVPWETLSAEPAGDDGKDVLWWCVGCGEPGRLDQTCPACGARVYTSKPPPCREVTRG